jgi:hypothetical protein
VTDLTYEDRRMFAITQLEMVLDVCGFMDEDDILDAADEWSVDIAEQVRMLHELTAMAEGTL